MTGIIDVHAHFVTDEYVAAAKAAGHDRPDGMPAWPTFSTDAQLRFMDDHGFDVAVLSVSSPGVHFGNDAAARTLARTVNEAGAAIRAAHPDRLGQVVALPLPDVEGSLAELAYGLDELGCAGAGIETNAHGHYLGDARFDPLWAELDTREAVLLVHPTSPPAASAVDLGRPRPMLEFMFDMTRTVSDLVFADVFRRFPRIRWVFTHGGGALPLLAYRIELFRRTFVPAGGDAPSVVEQLRGVWFDMAGTPFPAQMPALTAAVGNDHVVYGSDSCFTPFTAVAEQLASVDVAAPPSGAASWRELTTRNARTLFGPRLNATGRGTAELG